jgi:excisionase family DNA binding protein
MAQLSLREAAAELGVHPARITHWIASGKIRAEWIDGPHGRSRRIDADALNTLRRELRAESDPSNTDNGPAGANTNPDSLVRARAVESYTAGLAATAIAPAVSRLVETIEQLTRENGDLREQIGGLKARLEAHATVNDAKDDGDGPLDGSMDGEPRRLAHEHWDTLRERLDRLSQPLSESETAPVTTTSAASPAKEAGPRSRKRHRRPSPWERLEAWLREKTA